MNTTDIIDSLMNDYAIDGRDIQARIDELEALDAPTEEESAELADLVAFLHEAMQYNSDADEGETIIAESHFVDYIKWTIDDCYALPKELTSGEWPYRHITINYEAAAEEAKADYAELTFRGRNFYIQAR
mgnify:FL=1